MTLFRKKPNRFQAPRQATIKNGGPERWVKALLGRTVRRDRGRSIFHSECAFRVESAQRSGRSSGSCAHPKVQLRLIRPASAMVAEHIFVMIQRAGHAF